MRGRELGGAENRTAAAEQNRGEERRGEKKRTQLNMTTPRGFPGNRPIISEAFIKAARPGGRPPPPLVHRATRTLVGTSITHLTSHA